MKRSFAFSTSLAVGAITLATTASAFAQDYSYDYSSDNPAAGLAGLGIWAFCCMIPMLLLAVFNIWMLIDAIMRQEHEYPNSTGNTKLIWILLLVFFGLVVAIAYYFMVFRKIKRGRGGQPPMAGPSGGYQPPAAPPAAPPVAPPPPPPAPPVPPAPPAPPQA
jgi:uncharacterized membrane protein YidH (DUF202 family)